MEVHHHAHTSRKKWTHYFWEFLMLFLAVFCGFLAENQREHYVEHQREKQYIRSLVQDLNSDIIQSGETLKKLEATKLGIDSLIIALSSPGTPENSNEAYRLWSKNMGFADFFSNDRTIQQLKNSGSLRMIRNRLVSDSIMQYDRVVRDYYGQDDLMSRVLADQKQYFQMFDFIQLDKNTNTAIPVPLSAKSKLNEAYAYIKLWRFGLNALIKRLRFVNKTALSTRDLIQREYHVK